MPIPYPGMGIDRPQAEAFKQKLIEHHVDAVIAGNGGNMPTWLGTKQW